MNAVSGKVNQYSHKESSTELPQSHFGHMSEGNEISVPRKLTVLGMDKERWCKYLMCGILFSHKNDKLGVLMLSVSQAYKRKYHEIPIHM